MINTAMVYRQFGKPEEVLQPETGLKAKRAEHLLRVKMLLAPVNASDLIPITGAYRHRVSVPAVAGYEGVGRVIDAPTQYAALIGQRVLPLRAEGTWQQYVDCPPAFAIPVPHDIDNVLAARAYINPLAARLMLRHDNPAGKTVMITAAGSDCALLLGQWAQRLGASSVYGVYRSASHQEKLTRCGIIPVQQEDTAYLSTITARCDLVYDAVGGALAALILDGMKPEGIFVSYGLLSGKPYQIRASHPITKWFHVRHYLNGFTDSGWQQAFNEIWGLLRESELNDCKLSPLASWQEAVSCYRQPGSACRPLLQLGE